MPLGHRYRKLALLGFADIILVILFNAHEVLISVEI
jgi:hypothetical protein